MIAFLLIKSYLEAFVKLFSIPSSNIVQLKSPYAEEESAGVCKPITTFQTTSPIQNRYVIVIAFLSEKMY